MLCRDFVKNYSAYRDGLDPELAAEMEDHLEECPSCAAFDRAVRDGVELLRGETIQPSEDFLARLEARLAEEAPAPVLDEESSFMVGAGAPTGHSGVPRPAPLALTAVLVLATILLALTVKRPTVIATAVAAEQPDMLTRPRLMAGVPFVAFERIP